MHEYPMFIPPHYATSHKDEELEIDYSQWVDKDDRDHISGKVGKDRYGVWVTHSGLRLRVVKGEIEVYKKETTIIEDLDTIDEIIEEVEAKNE